MKAILSKTPGGPETLTLETVPDPKPGPGEILVRVRACGVNYPDVLVIQDLYQFKPQRPFSPGSEIAGVVEALGEGAGGFSLGARVFGSARSGGMAEKALLPAARVLPIPETMPFDDAAAFTYTFGTSYHALKDRAHLQKGETLLVLGAAGGVGLAAVQLGRAMGARVIAAASTQEKVDLARAHGAAGGGVYPPGPFDSDAARELAKFFKELCAGTPPDVIYDPVGGAYTEASLRAIARGGRHLVVGFPSGIPKLPLNLVLLKACQVVGVFWGDAVTNNPEDHRQSMHELLAFYEAGAIKPHISARYPLAQAPRAIADLAARRAQGKILITVE